MLRATNDYLTLFLCVLSTWVLVGAIPFFSLDGMYGQVDTQILFLHSFCSCLCFLQVIKFIFYKNEINKLHNILVIIPILLAVLGILSAIFNNIPLTTLAGSPQIGQGVFWYLDLAIMIVAFSGVLSNKKFRIIILVNLIILTTVATIFTINPFWKNLPISFFYFNDYLCFYGVLTFIILTTVTSNKFLIFVSYTCLGFYLYKLDNDAAIILWICAFILGIFLTILDSIRLNELIKKFKLIISSNFAFTTYICLLSIIILSLSFIFWKGTGPLSLEASTNPLVSAVVRGKIAEISMLSLLDVKTFFLGSGWGRVHELLLTNMNAWQYDQLTVGFNLHFHTHNELFEHFVSLGILGLILFVIFTYKLFEASNIISIYTKIGWLVFFLISCFWFFWAGTLPLIAVGIASLIALEKKEKPINFRVSKNTKYFYCFSTFLAGLFLSFGAWLTFSYTKEFNKISFGGLSKLVNEQSLNNIECDGFYNDNRGGFTLIPFMNVFPSYIISNQLPFEEQTLKVIEGVQCLARAAIKKGSASLDLISASVLLDSKLYFSGNKDAKNIFNSSKKYIYLKEKSLALVERAPKRGDLIVPYISLAVEQEKFDDAMIFCKNKEIKGIESICQLVLAVHALKQVNNSPEDIRKSIEYLALAKNKGLYNEKVYGWWFSEEVSRLSGYNKVLGVPLSGNLLYLISDKEVESIEKLLTNL